MRNDQTAACNNRHTLILFPKPAGKIKKGKKPSQPGFNLQTEAAE